MSTMPLVVYDSDRKNHRPIVEGKETLHPDLIPISLFSGNTIRQNPDGLYVGDYVMPPVLSVDGVNGKDEPLDFIHGTESICKTLDFVLTNVATYRPKQITIKLKAGQIFTLTKSYDFQNIHIIFTYFGDPKYPNAGEQYSTSTLPPELQEDLTRPMITSSFYQERNLWCINNLRLTNSFIDCIGISFSIPSSPTAYLLPDNVYSNYSDIFTCKDSTVSLLGVVINKGDVLSKFGLYGIESESVNSLKCYATRFFIQGRPAEGEAALAIRKYFIKFLSGRAIFSIGTNNVRSLVATSQGNTDNTGILQLFYSIISNLNDHISGSNTLSTFPLLDVDYGISNYIFDIRRSPTTKAPLNIISSIFL